MQIWLIFRDAATASFPHTTAPADWNNKAWHVVASDWEGWRETRSSLWKWSTIKAVANIRQSQFHFLLDQQTYKSTVTADVDGDFSFFVNSSCGLSLKSRSENGDADNGEKCVIW